MAGYFCLNIGWDAASIASVGVGMRSEGLGRVSAGPAVAAGLATGGEVLGF
jgi:hypothetical protein